MWPKSILALALMILLLLLLLLFLLGGGGQSLADSQDSVLRDVVPYEPVSREMISRDVVLAEEILAKIGRGESVEYDGVVVLGDLDLGRVELPEVERDWFEVEALGLDESVKLVGSSISITNSEVRGYLNFNNTIFEGAVNLWATNFTGYADFGYTRFEKEVYLGPARFEGVAEFPFAQFDGDANFRGARFARNAIFIGAQFGGEADFWHAGFGNVTFTGAQFKENARFEGARFDGDAFFDFALFEKDAWFDFIRFGKEAGFRGAQFGGDVRFSYTRFHGPFTLTNSRFGLLEVRWDSIEDGLVCDGPVYLALVKSFKGLEQFDDADSCYYRYRRQSQEVKAVSWSKLVDVLSWLSCGYGVRPANTIALSLMSILFFGAVFWAGKGIRKSKPRGVIMTSLDELARPDLIRRMSTDAQENRSPKRASFMDTLYFSLVVFTFQSRSDWHTRGPYRYIAVLEGILGILLFGLFVVTLGNIMIRY